MISLHLEAMLSASKIVAAINQAGTILAGLGVDDLRCLPAEQFAELIAGVHDDAKPWCEFRRQLQLAAAQLQESTTALTLQGSHRLRFDGRTVCRVIGRSAEQVVEFCLGKMHTLKRIDRDLENDALELLHRPPPAELPAQAHQQIKGPVKVELIERKQPTRHKASRQPPRPVGWFTLPRCLSEPIQHVVLFVAGMFAKGRITFKHEESAETRAPSSTELSSPPQATDQGSNAQVVTDACNRWWDGEDFTELSLDVLQSSGKNVGAARFVVELTCQDASSPPVQLHVIVPAIFLANFPKLSGKWLAPVLDGVNRHFPEFVEAARRAPVPPSNDNDGRGEDNDADVEDNDTDVERNHEPWAIVQQFHKPTAYRHCYKCARALVSEFGDENHKACVESFCDPRAKSVFCHSEDLLLYSTDVVNFVIERICDVVVMADGASPMKLSAVHIEWATAKDVCGVCGLLFGLHRDSGATRTIFNVLLRRLRRRFVVTSGQLQIDEMVQQQFATAGGSEYNVYSCYFSRTNEDMQLQQLQDWNLQPCQQQRIRAVRVRLPEPVPDSESKEEVKEAY